LTAALALTGTLWSNSNAATVDEALQVFDKIWPLWCEGRSLQLQGQNVTDAAERNRLAEQWYAKMDQIEQQTRNDRARFETIVAVLSKSEKDRVMQQFRDWPSRCAGISGSPR